MGKSLCDICLNTPKYIAQALKLWKPEDECMFIKKTSLYQLMAGDTIRSESLKDVQFYPKRTILNHDFNFYSTIYRALESNSY